MSDWILQQQDKQFCVLGLGLSGLSCVRYLVENGIQPSVCDTREKPPGLDELAAISLTTEAKGIEAKLGELDAEYLSSFDYLLMSPGVDPRNPIFEQVATSGAQLINEVELFALAEKSQKVVGVTGSNGKSTVVSLLGEVLNTAGLKTSVGGNIGRPMLDLLNDDADCFVIELSSFQLEFCPSLALDVATVLNISEDHMDRYDSIDEYAKTKHAIYRNAKLSLINADDAATDSEIAQNKQSFALHNQADWQVVDNFACLNNQQVVDLKVAKLVGEHNQLNMLTVIAIAEHLASGQRDKVAQGLAQYQGLAHRCQLIHQQDGIRWVDDSKATNVGATLAAISGLASQGELILLAGGVGKDADFSALKPALNSQLKALITFGRDGEQIAALKDDAIQVSDLETAVKTAKSLAGENDIVLLSPACASFDMFKNFEQRGLAFQQAVEQFA